jgi:CheY-like chemotaxis protein
MKTVLLIEDNLEIRENTAELLEVHGYKVVTAKNGKIGASLAIEKRPDIILCDILMPEKTGYEVFNELRQHPDTSTIPFIFVTASVEKKRSPGGH